MSDAQRLMLYRAWEHDEAKVLAILKEYGSSDDAEWPRYRGLGRLCHIHGYVSGYTTCRSEEMAELRAQLRGTERSLGLYRRLALVFGLLAVLLSLLLLLVPLVLVVVP